MVSEPWPHLANFAEYRALLGRGCDTLLPATRASERSHGNHKFYRRISAFAGPHNRCSVGPTDRELFQYEGWKMPSPSTHGRDFWVCRNGIETRHLRLGLTERVMVGRLFRICVSCVAERLRGLDGDIYSFDLQILTGQFNIGCRCRKLIRRGSFCVQCNLNCIFGCGETGTSTGMGRNYLVTTWTWCSSVPIADGCVRVMRTWLGRRMARFTSAPIAETGLPG